MELAASVVTDALTSGNYSNGLSTLVESNVLTWFRVNWHEI